MATQIPSKDEFDALKVQLDAIQADSAAALVAARANGGDLLQSGGETSIPRVGVAANFAPAANNTHFTYFTAKRTETINTLHVPHRSTAAVGATDIRFGVYEHDLTTNQLTLLASTANDTTLFNTGFKHATLALSAPVQKTAGKRYAIANRITATTMPNFWGRQAELGQNRQPYLNGYTFGTTLDASLTAVSGTSGTVSSIYYELLP